MTFRGVALSLVVLVLAIGAIFALLWIAALPLQPEYRTHVMVTSIARWASKSSARSVSISYQSEGGLKGHVLIPAEQLNCKVGEAVPAIQQGVIVELAPGACEKAPSL